MSKLSIACKEARETHYWLRLLAATDLVQGHRLSGLNLVTKSLSLAKLRFSGVCDFRVSLNIAMLLAEIAIARLLWQAILDIIINTVNQHAKGTSQ